MIYDIRFCPECGYMKIWCGYKDLSCPACGNLTQAADELNEGSRFAHMTEEDKLAFIASKAGHKIDPVMIQKRIQYEERKELEYQEWKRNKDASMPKTPTITCPYCQSTNTRKITTLSKAAHTFLFGIFSVSRNSKQWHCNNCDSDF